MRSRRHTSLLIKLRNSAFSRRYLLFTNISISMGLSAFGDLIEQAHEGYTGHLDRWDKRRTANMAAAGSVTGVICHYWYLFLDRRMPGRSINVVMKKIVLDQLICSPVNISAFFLTLGMLEGQPKQQIIEETKKKAIRLYIAEWVVWPIAQFINFYYLPTHYRILYDSFISLGYDVYTSYVKYRTS